MYTNNFSKNLAFLNKQMAPLCFLCTVDVNFGLFEEQIGFYFEVGNTFKLFLFFA
jgi:hypothetical protein